MSSIVQNKLAELRRKLTGWLIVHGLGRWLLTGIVVVVCSILLDRGFKMDLAQRSIVLVGMIGTAVGYFYWLVVRPLLNRAADDALILEVERKHPELRENLISSWQLERQAGTGELVLAGTSESLAQATIASGISKASSIDFADILDRTRHRRDLLVMCVGLLAFVVLALGIWQTSFLNTWFRRNLMLTNDSWPQATYLEIVGVQEGKLLIPRGADHRQLVLVTEDSSVKDVKVSLELEMPGGRSVQQLRPTGRLAGREHASVLYNVSSKFRMRALGGDDVTQWVEVDLVEPPSVLDIKLQSLLPSYTGIDALELAGQGPHTVLTGSGLDIKIQANKPLSRASVGWGTQSAEGEAESFALTKIEGAEYQVKLTPDQVRGGEYSIVLVDESGLENLRPTKFSLTVKEDQPPQVRASLLGISGIVVPQANLPTSYHVVDEYGLTRLFFETRWMESDTESDEEQRPLERNFEIAQFDATSSMTREVKDYGVLDLRPLQLQPGMSLRMAVAAADTCPQPPGIGRSQEFLLRIVSNEELRADLLRREVEQRKAFEQAYEKQMELAAELQVISVRSLSESQNPEQLRAQKEQELIALVRNQKNIGTLIAQVADRFEEFLVEIKNNRLDEAETELFPGQSIETRFDGGIIQPIRKLDQELIALVTRNIDDCRTKLNSESELLAAAEQTGAIHQEILAQMRTILSAMSDSENFQEVINDLLRIKDESQGLKREIQKQSKPKDIFDDPDKGVFDD